MNEEFYIGQIFESMYPKEAADWANANNAKITEIDPVEKETEEGIETVRRFEIQAIPEPPAPTHEDIRRARALAYQQEKDPITCHIQSLRDEEQTEEIQAEIAELIAERDAKVEEIRQRLPYPDEE